MRQLRVRRLVRLLAAVLADERTVGAGVELTIRADARPAIRSLRRAQRATRRLRWRLRLRAMLPRARVREERGQVFVELAIALPILVGLLFAIATVGYAMGTRGQLSNAAKIAAVAYADGQDPEQAALDSSDLDASTLTVQTTLSEGAGGLLYGVCLEAPIHVSFLVETWDRTTRSCALEERPSP
jgi:TadE-like protein